MNTIVISLIEKRPRKDGRTTNQVKSVVVKKLQTNARFLSLLKVIGQNEIPVLLEIQNGQLTTMLDCTLFTPYELWYFDENFQFTGKAYSLNEGPGTFQIQTQAKWGLFINVLFPEFPELKTLRCSELDLDNKFVFD